MQPESRLLARVLPLAVRLEPAGVGEQLAAVWAREPRALRLPLRRQEAVRSHTRPVLLYEHRLQLLVEHRLVARRHLLRERLRNPNLFRAQRVEDTLLHCTFLRRGGRDSSRRCTCFPLARSS